MKPENKRIKAGMLAAVLDAFFRWACGKMNPEDTSINPAPTRKPSKKSERAYKCPAIDITLDRAINSIPKPRNS